MGNYSQKNNYNNHHRNYQGGNSEQGIVTAEKKFEELKFQLTWIKNGATPEMVTFADEAAKYMGEGGLTASKIRAVYGEIKRIQMKKFEEERTAFYLLKPKVAYAVGREKATAGEKNCKGIKLFQLIFNECFKYVENDATYKNFCNFMEAIVAYHKVYQKKND